jgi:hypothetical protein
LRAHFLEDPGNEDRALHLARVLREAGRIDEADRMLARAFELESAP